MGKIERCILPLLISFILILGGCNKYEEGPNFSLRSKNKRLMGSWELKYAELTSTHAQDGDYYSVFENGVMSTTSPDYPEENASFSYAMNCEIKKDGSFTQTVVEDGERNFYTDNWFWFDGSFNKENIVLFDGGLYKIVKLTNKELIIQYDYSFENNQPYYDYVDDTTKTGFHHGFEEYYVFEKK